MTYDQYNRLRVHVSATPRQVVRAAYRMLSRQGKSRAARAARHEWLRAILREHRDAGRLYRQVMG